MDIAPRRGAESVHLCLPWQTIEKVNRWKFTGEYRAKPNPMMLVFGEADFYEKKGGKWVLQKRQTCRWEWLPISKIKRSIRKWIPKKKDPKDGEFEQWTALTKEEFNVREMALADALDTDAPMYDKVVADYRKEKEREDEEEANQLAQLMKKQKKEQKQAAKSEELQKNLKEKEKEVADLKEQLKGKSTHNASEVAGLKAALEAEKAKNSKLSEDIKGFEDMKEKYHQIPAEIRILSADELVKKLTSTQTVVEQHNLLKAKVLSYFEAVQQQKKDGPDKFKGNMKDIMPKSMQSFFDIAELV